jgi:hypothetical protein
VEILNHSYKNYKRPIHDHLIKLKQLRY